MPLVLLSVAGRGSWKATSRVHRASLFRLLCHSGDRRNVAVAERLALTFLCVAVKECAKTSKFLEGAWRDPTMVSARTCVESCSAEGLFLQ